MSPRKKTKTEKSKVKRFKKHGITLESSLTRNDLKESPTLLRGFTAGTEQQKLKRINARRTLLDNEISGRGGIRRKFLRPAFARRSPSLAKTFNPRRAGRPREHYLFFPVFEFTIIESFDQDEPKKRGKGLPAINRIDNYSTIVRYFAKAKLGAKAAWTVRVPTPIDSVSGEFAIRQTLQSYKKNGIDKKKLRELIRSVDDRLGGFAKVTGVRGVWRSPRSEQFAFREVSKREKKSKRQSLAGKFKPKKSKGRRRNR